MTITSNVLKEIVLPLRPLKQPDPSIVEGGDCGACVLAGFLGLKTVDGAYGLHIPGDYHNGDPIPKRDSFTRRSMVDTLLALEYKHEVDHVIQDVPMWPFGGARHYLSFGPRAQFEWRNYVRAMLSGGYYGLAQVRHGGWPANTPIEQFGTTNHWVMICGWRYVFEPETREDCKKICLGSYKEELLIGDSSKSRSLETWVEANEFQNRWGGFDSIWARPFVKHI